MSFFAGVEIGVSAVGGDEVDLLDGHHADLPTHLDRNAFEVANLA